MGNDTNRIEVHISREDLVKLLKFKILHFEGLDLVYKSLRFNDSGYLINLCEQYCETFLSKSQTKDLEDMKESLSRHGATLHVDISHQLISDAQLEAEDECERQMYWTDMEFMHAFKRMHDAIAFLESNTNVLEYDEYMRNQEAVHQNIKLFLAECLKHI